MNDKEWLEDGRKIPDDVMSYIRKMAVYSVKEKHENPEDVARIYNFNRYCIYKWIKIYEEKGYEGLDTIKSKGAENIITSEIDNWIKKIVLTKTPLDFDYETHLWTSLIIAQLLKKQFDIDVCDDTVSLHLKAMRLSYQKPCYFDTKKDDKEIDYFLNEKFPKIKQLAEKLDADIAFEDESGFKVNAHVGRTWGLKGKTPIISVSTQRSGINVLSAVTPKGKMQYSLSEKTINSDRFIKFLKQLIYGREKPLILFVDRVPFHLSKKVREFVKNNRKKLRIYFLPRYAPDYNPDEQVWNEMKNNRIGKRPIKNKADLKEKLKSELASLQKMTKRIISFFKLPNTQYAFS
ncbi:IS630 family transposase [Patescibacteria group bacterium]|nr:MAG: IS630 family transposase [Patescibacteria group bacterium]